jgi:hypothetical protein
MSTIETPQPPGKNGLPLLGETLAFAKNPFASSKNVFPRTAASSARTSSAGRP